MSSRYFPHDNIATDGILSLDEDSVLSTNEVSKLLIRSTNALSKKKTPARLSPCWDTKTHIKVLIHKIMNEFNSV